MRIKTALVLGLLLVFTAACGGEDGDGVASADTATDGSADGESPDEGADGAEQALAYSQCMRDNGVENFPDPEISDGGGVSLSLGDEVDPGSEEFMAAEEACEDLLPGAGEEAGEVDPADLEHMREYSQCMRDNGIEGFPDPSSDGGIMIDGDELGVDPTGPEMRAAEEACEDYLESGPGSGTNTGEDE